jgi:nucleoside phosphorylase
MVLVGMAGSISDDVNPLDVIVARHVIGYDQVAETTKGKQMTGTPLPPMPIWVNDLTKKLEKLHGNVEVELQSTFNLEESSTFKVFKRAIGSGGSVVKDPDAESKKMVKTVARKASATETEGIAFVRAYFESTLIDHNRTAGFLILRGIADNADPKKDKSMQHWATHNAMHVLAQYCLLAEPGFSDYIPST